MCHRLLRGSQVAGVQAGVYASTTWFRKRVDLAALRKYTIWNAHYGVSSSPIDCACGRAPARHACPAIRAIWT